MIGVIIQARSGSKRYPRKIYEDLNGKYTLQRVLEGVKKNSIPDKIVLAMPEYDKPECLRRQKMGEFDQYIDERFNLFFGNSDDLVDRYFGAANQLNLDIIVRVTADCPFGGVLTDDMLKYYLDNRYFDINGFLGNNKLVTDLWYSDGLDNEIFTMDMLEQTWKYSTKEYDREHCTPYMYRENSQFPIFAYKNTFPNPIISTDLDDFSFDTQEDYELLLELTAEYDKHHDLDKAIRNITK